MGRRNKNTPVPSAGLTPDELKNIRLSLGLSSVGWAELIQVDARTARGWEANPRRGILPGSVVVLAELLRDHPEVRVWLGTPIV